MERVRFNGPSRHNDQKLLKDDLKLLKMMLKPVAATTFKTKSHQQSSLAVDLIDQLPNTISISFRDLIGHELVSTLSSKVCSSFLPYSSFVGALFSVTASLLLNSR
jgi:hypothetical protein